MLLQMFAGKIRGGVFWPAVQELRVRVAREPLIPAGSAPLDYVPKATGPAIKKTA